MGIVQLLFGFNGRIRRTHYWLGWFGAGFAISTVFWVTFFIFGGAGMLATAAVNGGGNTMTGAGAAAAGGLGMLLFLMVMAYAAALFWVHLALQVKRWHDRDKSGVWVLINLIPVIGWVWALIECGFLDGTPGPNAYGPSPKGLTGPIQAQPTSPMPPPLLPAA
jgi:uncharacterized membrane protein YhaH (DUF805 family)